MPTKNSKKGGQSKTKAKAKTLGKEVNTLEKRIHNLKIRGVGDVSKVWSGDLPHGYTPSELLAPISRLSGKVSAAGIAWAIEHMDPNGVPFTSQGIPDCSTGTRHIRPVRYSYDIDPPNLGPASTNSTANWDLAIISTPFITLPYLAIRKLASSPWPDFTDPYVLSSIGWHVGGVTSSQTTGPGTTYIDSLWWLVGNKDLTGIVPTTGPWPDVQAAFLPVPDFASGFNASQGTLLRNCYSKYRRTASAVTTELIGPMIYKGGRVISGQLGTMVEPNTQPFNLLNAAVALDTTNGNGWGVGQWKDVALMGSVSTWFLPPIGSEHLVEADPLYAERPAEAGDYNVNRLSLTNGVPVLRSAAEASYPAISSEVAFMEADNYPFRATGSVGDSTHLAWIDYLNDNNYDVAVLFQDGWNTQMIYYEGVNPNQAIRLKHRAVIEGVPTSLGPYASLAKVAPDADPMAIQMVADITNRLPHSYPADYNDLGGLLGVLGRVLTHLGMPALRLVSTMGVPVLSPVAAVIHGIARSTWGEDLS